LRIPADDIRRLTTDALGNERRRALRALFGRAWDEDEFTDDDWQHALGGTHFFIEADGEIVSHASVVPRELHTSGRVLHTGYVEAVATHPAYRGEGFASALLRAAGEHIDANFALGALDTGKPSFYERFGWRLWQGPTYVRMKHGIMRTAKEDGCVMVRLTPAVPDLDLAAPISCDWRAGDAW
jgi:aminoglycoside 2'-N-acetyltransferase I